jgi:serine O-acetyltransferase
MYNWSQLKADTYRQYGQFSWAHLIKGLITRRTFRVIVTMRLCQAVANSSVPYRFLLPPLRLIHRMTTNLAAIDLSWRTKVGAGLDLVHGWGIVISPGTQIGNNVTIFHGATLGRRDRILPEGARLIGYPILEDEVWIGPHAIIVGGVTIGRGSRIAGGAFVTENIPPYSVVVGNPSTIVKSKCIPDVMNQAPLYI